MKRLVYVWLAVLASVAPLRAVSINPATGQVAAGVGGGRFGIDNRDLDGGGAGIGSLWVDATHAAYQHIGVDGSLYVAMVDAAGTVTPVSGGERGANQVSAGGGVIAWWLAGSGLFTNIGFSCGACGVPEVGPDGAIAYTPDYQAGTPWVVRERDGSTWTLEPDVAQDIELLGSHRAVYRNRAGSVVTVGLPQPTLIAAAWRPRVIVLGSENWVCYWTDQRGLVLHPFGDPHGYVLHTTPDAFDHDAQAIGPRTIRVAWSSNQAESPGSLTVKDINVDTEARVDLTIPAVTPTPAPVPAPTPAPTSAPAPTPAQVPTAGAFSWDGLQIVGGAPDVRHWAETTALTRVAWTRAGMELDFDAKNRWPDVTPPGWDGPLQFTVWLVQPNGQGGWAATGIIQVWRGLNDVGGDMTDPTQIGKNWTYFAAPPMHQPQAGEQIGVFVTAGNQRMTDNHAVAERSNVVFMPWTPGGMFTFSGAIAAPVSAPTPNPTPVADPLQAQIDSLHAQLADLQQQLTDLTVLEAQTAADRDAAQGLVAQLQAQITALQNKPAPSCTAKVPAIVKSLGIKVGCTVSQ